MARLLFLLALLGWRKCIEMAFCLGIFLALEGISQAGGEVFSTLFLSVEFWDETFKTESIILLHWELSCWWSVEVTGACCQFTQSDGRSELAQCLVRAMSGILEHSKESSAVYWSSVLEEFSEYKLSINHWITIPFFLFRLVWTSQLFTFFCLNLLITCSMCMCNSNPQLHFLLLFWSVATQN